MAPLIRRATLILALATYIASMFLPLATSGADFPGDVSGWYPGWIGLFAVFIFWDHAFGPLFFLSWFANPLFGLSFVWLIVEKPTRAAIAGGAGFVLAMLVLPAVVQGMASYPAYWIWLGSFAVLAIGSGLCNGTRRREVAPVVDEGIDVDDRIRRL